MTRATARWLIAPLALAATIAIGAPKASTTNQIMAASLGRIDLSSTPAALPAALAPLATGERASASRVNAAQTHASLSGADSAVGRLVVPLGDTNSDGAPDLLDVRASGGTLGYQLLSGSNGMTLWTGTTIERPADVYAAVFPAAINAGATDVYLLEQYQGDSSVVWTLHAIDGATGAEIWSSTGSLPTGIPQSAPPSIPPSIPPSLPGSPSGLPSTLPSVPTLPSEVPALPGEVPSDLPVPLPSEIPPLPSEIPPLPSEIPPLPGDLPVPLPSGIPTLPGEVPSEAPVPVPSEAPTIDPGAPPSLPPVPSEVPSNLPTPTISPSTPSQSAAGRRSAQNSSTQSSAIPFAAYVTGATPVDVDGDAKPDFPLTQTVAFTLPDSSTAVVSSLSTVAASSGRAVGTVVGAARNAVPYVGVSGDFLGAGGTGLLAVDEVSADAARLITYRGFTSAGVPTFVATESAPVGLLSVYAAADDITGDGRADVLVNRIPSVPGGAPSTVTVFSAPLGQVAWTRTFADTAIAVTRGSIDGEAGTEVLTQGLEIPAAGKIPSGVIYRALHGANGGELYVKKVLVANGGGIGDWSAKLTADAGRIDGDALTDFVHTVNAVPTDGQASLWSQAAVSAASGGTVWARTTPINPGKPVGGNIVDDAAADIVDVQESATKYSDSLVMQATTGKDGSPAWFARVLVGGSTERVRDLSVQAMQPQGTGDLVVTVCQRSGTRARSLVVGVRGTTGQVLWIRTN